AGAAVPGGPEVWVSPGYILGGVGYRSQYVDTGNVCRHRKHHLLPAGVAGAATAGTSHVGTTTPPRAAPLRPPAPPRHAASLRAWRLVRNLTQHYYASQL